MADENIKNL